MNNSYFSSVKNTVLSLKPSRSIRLLLMVLFVCLFGNVVNAATYYSRATGNWSSNTTWSLTSGGTSVGTGIFPGVGDTVIIEGGFTVTVNTNTASLNSLTISSGSTLITTDPYSVSATTITVNGTYKAESSGIITATYFIVNGGFELSKTTDITVTTSIFVVSSSGGIKFDHSVLRLPSNISLYLQHGRDSLGGDCNGQDKMYVGNVEYAVCEGNALHSFIEVEDAGGINNTNTASSGSIGTAQTICSGATPAALTSTTNGTGSGIITYEWQANAGSGYSTISGATNNAYSPQTLTATTSYQRRTVSTIGSSTSYSAYTTPVIITVNTIPVAPTGITGSTKPCALGSSTSYTYSIAAVVGATSYTWTTSGTGWTITPAADGLSATITFAIGATQANLEVRSFNSCGTNGGYGSLSINPIQTPTTATISSTTSVCQNGTRPNITITNPQNFAIRVNYTINGVAQSQVYISANSSINYISAPTNTTGTFTYALVSVLNGDYELCPTIISGSTVITVTAPPSPPTVGAITQPTCSTATGSFTILNYNAAYIYTITPSTGVSRSGSSVTAPVGTYAISASLSGCGSSTTGFTINTQPATLVQPTFGAVTQPTCSTATGSFTITNYNSAYTYVFTPSTGVVNTAGAITAPAGSYTVKATLGACTSVASASAVVNAQPATPAAPTITAGGQTTFCPGGSVTLTSSAGTSYLWSTGATTQSISATTSGSYTVKVTNASACQSAVSVATDVTVIPTLSVNLTSTGTPSLCLRDLGTLNVTETAGVTITSRQWGIRAVSGGPITLITGAINPSLNPNDYINPNDALKRHDLEIPTNFILVCTSTSTCNVSAVSNEITVKAPPPTPLAIEGDQSQCVGRTGQVYSVPLVPGADQSKYHWYLPADWVITSGADASGIGTRQITVTMGGPSTSTIRVHSANECGESYAGSYLYVSVVPLSVGGTVTPISAVTCGTNPSTVLTVKDFVGSIIGWESSTNISFSTYTEIQAPHYELYLSGLGTTYTQDTYFRAVALSGDCGFAYSAPVLVKMTQPMANPGGILVNGAAYPHNSGITHCANTSTGLSIAPVANATSYTWVLPSGWSPAGPQVTTSPTITVTTGSNSTSGNVQVYASNTGCGNTQSSYLYFNLVPSNAPSVTLTQPTCTVNTGTITVTSPANAPGITYTVVGTNPAVDPITNATGVFAGLAVGNYNVTSNNGFYDNISAPFPKAVLPLSDCATTSSVTLSPLVNKTWNGTAWSPASNPTANENIEFTGNYSLATDVTACSCTVTSGTVKIPTGNNLILGGKLTVNTPGTLTFENNASLVQTSFTGANTGSITYQRATTTTREFDFTYWSSPVAGQNLLAVSPSTKLDKFFSFNATVNDWKQETPSTTTMTIGKGYIIRGVPLITTTPPRYYTAAFYGVPNNGVQQIAVVAGATSNLIGNPYPSAIYADQFLFDNKLVIDGTIYFWTHNTPIAIGTPNPGTGVWAYSGDDYASYNLSGGVGTGTGTFAGSSGPAIKPTGKIAAGQSFFTTSTEAGGTVKFTNTMRVDGSGNPLDNSNFYKTKNPKAKTTTIEKNRVWLNLTNTQGAFKQTLVGYITGATNTWDNLYDGESFDGNNFLDFYSINDEKNLTIQGRALPFDENDEIPLGYRVAVGGKFAINIDQTDGLLTNQPVYLEDKVANTITDLKIGNYTFSTTAGIFNDRFVLRYKDKAEDKTLSVDETDVNDGIIVLYSNNYKTLIIRNNEQDTIVNSVTLFNMSGQQINSWKVKDSEQTSIQIPIKDQLSFGIYIVKINTTKGESSKKIIVK